MCNCYHTVAEGEGCLIPVQFRNNLAANISTAVCHEGAALVFYCSNPVHSDYITINLLQARTE